MVTLWNLLEISNNDLVDLHVYENEDATSEIDTLSVSMHKDGSTSVLEDEMDTLNVIVDSLRNMPVHCLTSLDGACAVDIYLSDLDVQSHADLQRDVLDMYEEYPELRTLLLPWYNIFKED